MSQMKEVYQDRKRIVDVINDILETTWTEYDFENGKELDVPPSWRIHIGYLIRKYKDHGWIVTRNITISSESPHTRRDYLNFKNPVFKQVPRELRSRHVKK